MMKILALDDKSDNLVILKAILKDAFPEALFLSALNGPDGIELATAEDPDVILLDVVMPEMDGFEVCRYLKQDERVCDIPIVFVTAQDYNKENRIKAIEAGAEAFLVKPIDSIELEALIKAMVKIKRTDKHKRYEKEYLDTLVAERTREFEESQTNMLKLVEELQAENEAQQKIETELRESKERWESLFNNSPNAIAVYQPIDDGRDFVFTDFNLAAQKIDKMNRDEVVGKSISELFPAAEELGFLEVFRKVAQTGAIGNITSTYYNDNRIEGWRENIIYRLNTGEIVAIYSDVTEKIKAALSLKESEEKFHSIFENHVAIKLIIDPENGNIADGNKAAENYYGWPLDELKLMKIQQLNIEPSEEVKTRMENVLERKQNYFEAKHRLKDGSIRDVEVFSSKILIGNKDYLHSIVHDNTDRKQAEASLLESNKLNKSLLQTIPFGMDIVDEEGNILFLSDNLLEILEYVAIGKKCWELYRDDKKQCWDCPLVKGIQIGQTKVYESQGVFGGKTFQISHTGIMFQGKKAMLEIFQDITEKKKMLDDLILAKEQAVKSDNLKTAFLHNISHEVRTPLNGILGFGELLASNDFSGDEREKYYRILKESSARLVRTINDYMDISLIVSGNMEVTKGMYSIRSIMDELLQTFQPRCDAKEMTLNIVHANLTPPECIYTDYTLLLKILDHLLNNALKFSNKGEISMGYDEIEDAIEFYVKDEGIGIDAEKAGQIFQNFTKAEDSETSVYEGTGLGLAISKGLAQLLGGDIRVESVIGVGSIFFVTLPSLREQQQ